MTLTSGSIEGKQLNVCRGNIIFCHVDSFCLQERKKKEDEVRSIFLLTRLRRPPQQKSYMLQTAPCEWALKEALSFLICD